MNHNNTFYFLKRFYIIKRLIRFLYFKSIFNYKFYKYSIKNLKNYKK